MGFSLGTAALAAVLAWQRASEPSDVALAAALRWRARDPAFGSLPMLVVDFDRPSFVLRGHLWDPEASRVVESFFVAHGERSGWASVETVSNEPGSYRSSAGAFRAGELYRGRHGLSRRLEGLEPGSNDQAFARAIVIHGAPYADGSSIIANFGRLGRSEGCLALPPDVAPRVVALLERGALVYVHAPRALRAD